MKPSCDLPADKSTKQQKRLNAVYPKNVKNLIISISKRVKRFIPIPSAKKLQSHKATYYYATTYYVLLEFLFNET